MLISKEYVKLSMSKLGSRKLCAQIKTISMHKQRTTSMNPQLQQMTKNAKKEYNNLYKKTSSTDEFEETFGKLQLQQYRQGHPRKV